MYWCKGLEIKINFFSGFFKKIVSCKLFFMFLVVILEYNFVK